MGTGTTIRSCMEVQAAKRDVVCDWITLFAMSAMCWNSGCRFAMLPRNAAMSDQLLCRNGYGHPFVRTRTDWQVWPGTVDSGMRAAPARGEVKY
jgi:hypothetical protein